MYFFVEIFDNLFTIFYLRNALYSPEIGGQCPVVGDISQSTYKSILDKPLVASEENLSNLVWKIFNSAAA